MDDDRVLDAALEVFLKYGYRRATMADIARCAGVSRPTLYVRYPNKQAAFRGVVVRGTAELLREVEAVLESAQPLPEKLQGVFEIWTVRPFALAARSCPLTERGNSVRFPPAGAAVPGRLADSWVHARIPFRHPTGALSS